MAGSPSLGTNFAYNPFRQPQRRQQMVQGELPENFGTGFSPDGLSYEVASDFPKLAAQALASYEAALGAERQNNLSIDSRGIVNAPPVDAAVSRNLYDTLVAPTMSYITGQPMGGGGFRSPQPIVRGSPDDGIFERDPLTGSWDNVVPPTTKAAAPELFEGPITAGNIATLEKPKLAKKTAQQWERDLRLGLVPPSPQALQYADWGRQSNALSAPVSAPIQTQIPPMPATKAELRNGVTYQTPRGPARWDGSKFVQ